MLKVFSLGERCTGCAACFASCPHRAITMRENQEGFLFPHLNESLCVNCGKCDQSCPILKEVVDRQMPDSRYVPEAFAVNNKDLGLRISSTSGGFFSELAKYCLDDGFYVCGAVFDENFNVRHIVTNKLEDLTRLKGSKYAQSDTTFIFPEVERLLKGGDKVLFCGTPCQVGGLRSFLGQDYESLALCSFICLGVGSPVAFRCYLKDIEEKYQAKIISFQFKNKDNGWHLFSSKALLNNGNAYLADRYHDPYMTAFLRHKNIYRKSCYQCSFRKLPIVADIVMADFWGVEKLFPELDDNCGTSAILISTPKGKELFRAIDNNLEVIKSDFQDVIAENMALFHNPVEKGDRVGFFAALREMPFEKAVRKFNLAPAGNKTVVIMSRNAVKSLAMKSLKITGLSALKKHFLLTEKNIASFLTFIKLNYFSRQLIRHRGCFFYPCRNAVLDLTDSCRIGLKGTFVFGRHDHPRSRLESRFQMLEKSNFELNGNFTWHSGGDIRIFSGGRLVLNGGYCNQGVEISCVKKIIIGRNCVIGRNVVIRDFDGHDILFQDSISGAAEVEIGNHVWLGARAMIMKGVKIGSGSIVAAGAIVTKNVPPNTLVGGCPARILREDVSWK